MNYQKITAIFPEPALKNVELHFLDLGVPGMTVSKVHGYGEYRDFYKRDCMSDCVRVDIFVEEEKTDAVTKVIMEAAHVGLPGDGIIAITPVEKFLHIRDFKPEASNDIE